MGLFASPNQTGIMNSLPAHQRGVGAGMAATFQNSAMVLSIGIFFSLMIIGLAASLPATLHTGSSRRACPQPTRTASRTCRRSACCSPRSSGYNPMQQLLGPHVLASPLGGARGVPDRPRVLPVPDLGAVPERACTRRSTSRSPRA